ncbi:MAG: hypothetical protein JRG90_12625 [Deltaproteobacteria bacterium]|nr:hypothetical protein [Deltaproteobacteria bacterium]
MNNFLSGFGDELAKIAARRGVKIIRDLVARGDISKADRLAKTKGVIAPSRAESFIPKVDGTKVKWTERGHLGSEIRHLGEPGQENLATLVADPIHGIAARKIRHGNSTVPKAMRGHTGAVANDPSMKGLIARRLGDVRHELSGRHVSFDEYVSGHNAQKFLNTASQADQVAIGRVVSGLEQTVKRRAKAMGYVVDDINAKNVIVNKNASGRWTGKVIDFTAEPVKSHQGFLAAPSNPPARSTILRKTFNQGDESAAFANKRRNVIEDANKPPPRGGAKRSVKPRASGNVMKF